MRGSASSSGLKPSTERERLVGAQKLFLEINSEIVEEKKESVEGEKAIDTGVDGKMEIGKGDMSNKECDETRRNVGTYWVWGGVNRKRAET